MVEHREEHLSYRLCYYDSAEMFIYLGPFVYAKYKLKE